MTKATIFDASLFQRYLQEKSTFSDSSIYVYVGGVIKFLKTNPDIDNLEDYNNFIIKHCIKKRANYYYSILKKFIEFSITDNGLRAQLIEGLIQPPIREDIIRERRHLSEDELLTIINSMEKRKHRVIALIQTMTGVRAGDILRLRRENIIPEEYEGNEVLRINITGKRRKRNVVYIHDKIAQHIIWEYILNNHNFGDYYFVELGKMKGREGNPKNEHSLIQMNYLWFWYDLKQALNTVGIDKDDFSTHDFRRCFARRAWTKWKDIHVLQKLLNHKDPKVTLRYLEQSGLQNIDYHYEMQQ